MRGAAMRAGAMRAAVPAALAAALLAGATLPAAAGRRLAVRPDGQGPYASIQAAVDAAGDGDVVVLADGIYAGEGNRDVDLRGKAVRIVAAGDDPAACVVDCTAGAREAAHRAFVFRSGEGAEAGLRGLTVRHGRAVGGIPDGAGGAVLCRGASPVIEDCVFAANRAEIGGAVACLEGAAPRLTGCVFRRNTAAQGGAVHCLDAAPELHGCFFVLNAADRGGGLGCYRADAEVLACTFDRNVAQGGGGIMCEAGAVPAIRDCLFCGNVASIGGGLSVEDSAPRVDACTFAVNSAGSGGGVNWLGARGARLHRCIIAYSTQGEALACHTDRDLDVSCCLIWSNAGGDWVGVLQGEDARHGNLWTAPLFVRPARGDFRLRQDSPGRTAGACALLGASDPRLAP